MNAVNYNAEMHKIIERLKGGKPKLLMHACCAPCSSSCLERLKDHFEASAYFYNPNIENGEYIKRKNELIRFITETGWADLLECGHDEGEFYSAVKGLESCPEGGKRCAECFRLRLKETARAAKENGYDYFTTTLTLSPLKDASLINSLGEELGKEYGVNWLYCDFKKENGYLRSLQLSKQYSLYRQDYCGCVFSRRNT